MIANSSAENGFPSAGIRSDSSVSISRAYSELFAALPGTIAGVNGGVGGFSYGLYQVDGDRLVPATPRVERPVYFLAGEPDLGG